MDNQYIFIKQKCLESDLKNPIKLIRSIMKEDDIHIEDVKEIKQTMDNYVDKVLPLMPALGDVKTVASKSKIGINKTTKSASLGRKLTKAWAKRQVLYGLVSALFLSYGMGRFIFMVGAIPEGFQFIFYILLTIVLEVIFISFAFRQIAGSICTIFK